jgi:L-2-hydroxyglutarate oxidase LhgO
MGTWFVVRRGHLFGASCLAASGFWWAQRTHPSDAFRQSEVTVQTPVKLHADVIVVGGGIVGTAVAREIIRTFPHKTVHMIEKDADVACHQSSHNSGVIHAGMYYTPGSSMARLCVEGARRMYEYCQLHNLSCERVGKLIVATTENQRSAVEELFRRGNVNGVKDLHLLSNQNEIHAIEPLVSGVAALWSPNTGIADFSAVVRHMHRALLKESRFSSVFRSEVLGFSTAENSAQQDRVVLAVREPGQKGPLVVYSASNVIVCSGLHNNHVAAIAGDVVSREGPRVMRSLSFRGRYYQLKPTSLISVKANVYPCPTGGGIPVGIHFTPTVDERRGRGIIIGPGSAMCTAFEGYTASRWELSYLLDILQSSAVWTFLIGNIGVGFQQFYTDQSRSRFLQEAQKLIPTVTAEDITDSFTGVMAAGIGESGEWVSDLSAEFTRPKPLDEQVARSPNLSSMKPLLMNIRNAPSPCATASLAVAEDVVVLAAKHFRW